MSKRSLPWLQFFPADWKSDAVAGCSLAAQGLWLNMMLAMHQSQSYGRLEVDGHPIPDEVLFRRLGCVSVEEYRRLLDELFTAGVPSRDSDGIIYSRRMVRDQAEREATAERVRRHRDRIACNASVTPMSQGEVRSQKSEVRDQKSESKQHLAPKATAPADARHKPFSDFAYEAYRQKHGTKPLWQGKDFSALKRLLKAQSAESLPLSRLTALWGNYLNSTEPFTVKQGDGLSYFCSNINRFADGPQLAVPRQGGVDGNHISSEERIRRGDVAGTSFLENNRGVAADLRPTAVSAKPKPQTVN